MPEEIPQVIPPVENVQPSQSEPQSSQKDYGDDLDKSLEALFKDPNNLDQSKNEPQKEESKSVEEPKEVNPEPPKEEEKVKESDDKLLDPASIKEPKGFRTEESKNGFRTLRSQYDKSYKLVRKQNDEIRQLKTSLAEKANLSVQELDKLKKDNEELKQYRYMLDAEHDPDFIQKYEKPMGDLKKEMSDILRKFKATDDQLKNFDFTNTDSINAVYNALLNEAKDTISANQFMRRAEKFSEMDIERKKFVGEYKDKYQQLQEGRRKERFNSDAQEQGVMFKTVQEMANGKSQDGKPLFPNFQKLEVPSGASEAEATKINRHNEVAVRLNQNVEDLIKLNTPQDRAKIAFAAVYGDFLKYHNDYLSKQNQSLQAEIAKISKVGTERRTSNQPVPVAPGTYKTPESLDLDDALSENFPGMMR